MVFWKGGGLVNRIKSMNSTGWMCGVDVRVSREVGEIRRGCGGWTGRAEKRINQYYSVMKIQKRRRREHKTQNKWTASAASTEASAPKQTMNSSAPSATSTTARPNSQPSQDGTSCTSSQAVLSRLDRGRCSPFTEFLPIAIVVD